MLSDMKDNAALQNVESQIQEIKKILLTLGDLRPGSLTRQYNVCGKAGCRCKHPTHPKRHGPYYQLSYTHNGQSTSRFVRPIHKTLIKEQLVNYKTFRKLIHRWIVLAIRKSELLLKDKTPQLRQNSRKISPSSSPHLN